MKAQVCVWLNKWLVHPSFRILFLSHIKIHSVFLAYSPLDGKLFFTIFMHTLLHSFLYFARRRITPTTSLQVLQVEKKKKTSYLFSCADMRHEERSRESSTPCSTKKALKILNEEEKREKNPSTVTTSASDFYCHLKTSIANNRQESREEQTVAGVPFFVLKKEAFPIMCLPMLHLRDVPSYTHETLTLNVWKQGFFLFWQEHSPCPFSWN